MSVGSRESPRVYQVLQHWGPREMSGIEVQRFQHACRKGYKTYDNRTEEIQLSRRTTYKAQARRVTAARTQSEHGAEDICNYGSCPHEGDGRQDQGPDMSTHTTDPQFRNERQPRSTGPRA